MYRAFRSQGVVFEAASPPLAAGWLTDAGT